MEVEGEDAVEALRPFEHLRAAQRARRVVVTGALVLLHTDTRELVVQSTLPLGVLDSPLPSLIQSVYRSLSTAGGAEAAPVATLVPGVPIKKSVFPDYIVGLEDGKKLKMLKRHLQARYGLSPDMYRAKWGLPREYPMITPIYAATRSGLAKQFGLGRKPASAPAAEPEVQKPSAPRARAKA
jgi:predicted transcriptional regulator